MPAAESASFPGLVAVARLPQGDSAEALAATTLLEGSPDGDAGPAPEVLRLWNLLGEKQTAEKPPAQAQAATGSKQGQLKLRCPNCGSVGSFPWGRLNSTLCCSHCWTWYRLASHGKLEEVPAPKDFDKGALRGYKDNGKSRTVEVTPAEIKRNRRKVQRESRLEAIKDLNLSDGLVLWLAAAYLAGMFVFGLFIVFSASTPTIGPKGPIPPLVRKSAVRLESRQASDAPSTPSADSPLTRPPRRSALRRE